MVKGLSTHIQHTVQVQTTHLQSSAVTKWVDGLEVWF